jgi:hypothetical protein
MVNVPIIIGSAKAQARFSKENQAFLEECPRVYDLLHKVFIRTLAPPTPAEFASIQDLPEDSAPVNEFFNKMLADRTVFYLGRIAGDDFNELFTLAGNGYGFGALKILRSMYEHTVTAAFIAKNPSQSEHFANDSAIKKGKIWKKMVEWMPEIADRYTTEQRDWLDKNYKEALVKLKSSMCKKCGQPVTQEAWTRVDLDTMAKKTDDNLAFLYSACYLEPLCHSHATSFGLELHLVETEDAVKYRDESPTEARKAIMLGHNLILRVIALQNGYFHLGLDGEVIAASDGYSKIWGQGHQEQK